MFTGFLWFITLMVYALLICFFISHDFPLRYCILLFVVFIIGSVVFVHITDDSPIEHYDDGLLKTVAHLDLSVRDDLELVTVDYENDVAYYRYVMPDKNVKVGDTVYLINDIEATLLSVDAVGFTFDCDTSVEAGMSGTAVLNTQGEQIGYISKRLENGKYYCIWS